MDNAFIVQIFLGIFSCFSLIISFKNFASHRMTETIEFWWVILNIVILTGAFIDDYFLWCNDIPLVKALIPAVLMILVLYIIFQLCRTISVLVNKNHELAMQVSLLNQENEQILIKTGMIPDRFKSDDKENEKEKDTVRN